MNNGDSMSAPEAPPMERLTVDVHPYYPVRTIGSDFVNLCFQTYALEDGLRKNSKYTIESIASFRERIYAVIETYGNLLENMPNPASRYIGERFTDALVALSNGKDASAVNAIFSALASITRINSALRLLIEDSLRSLQSHPN